MAGGGGWWFLFIRPGRPAAGSGPPEIGQRSAIPAGVGCTGRIEPEGGIIVVAAPGELGQAPVIAKVFVEEGQQVAPGQAIAVLESLSDLEAAVQQATARLDVARSRLDQVRAGARRGDTLALQSEVARMEAESKAARQELQRKEALLAKDFVPRVEVDAARLKVEETDRSLDALRHRLDGLTEVPETDLHLAQAEVTAAEADLDRARIQQSAGTIRAPQVGRVIRVLARAGEAVGPEGVITLANTKRMNVVAEVYETDVARVHPGQKARITADWLFSPVEGIVRWINPQIESRTLPVEPSAAADQRVYEARIQMSHPELFADRINAKVDVLIEP
jgi:HlyD family secretion protein